MEDAQNDHRLPALCARNADTMSFTALSISQSVLCWAEVRHADRHVKHRCLDLRTGKTHLHAILQYTATAQPRERSVTAVSGKGKIHDCINATASHDPRRGFVQNGTRFKPAQNEDDINKERVMGETLEVAFLEPLCHGGGHKTCSQVTENTTGNTHRSLPSRNQKVSRCVPTALHCAYVQHSTSGTC